MIIIQLILTSILLGLISFIIYMIKYKSVEKKYKNTLKFMVFSQNHHAGIKIMLIISILPIIGVLINLWGLFELFYIKD